MSRSPVLPLERHIRVRIEREWLPVKEEQYATPYHNMRAQVVLLRAPIAVAFLHAGRGVGCCFSVRVGFSISQYLKISQQGGLDSWR